MDSVSIGLFQFYFHFVLKRLRSKETFSKMRTVYAPKLTRENQISQREKEDLVQYGQDLLRDTKGIN